MKPEILLVDDDENIRESLSAVLTEESYSVETAETGREAIKKISTNSFALLITDLRLPDTDGVKLYQTIKKTHPETLAIIITGHGSFSSAVEAIRLGVYDYIEKPFKMDGILLIVKRALRHAELLSQNIHLKRELGEKYHPDNIVGTSTRMQDVYDVVKKVAGTDATVLIRGESGTGKELAARAIHYLSRRKNGRFIVLSCGALPETLLESELFGYEKGAFTGALSRKPGLFETADGGTLFLDEVGDLSPSTQVKLLRVLQEREFQPVGAVKQVKVDIRLISATNKDIEKVTKEGKFREDLYYRLNVVQIELPPLRDRKDDIPLLVKHFLKKFGCRETVSEEAMALLIGYHWQGNVRELENVIERAIVLKKGDSITPDDLPERFFQPSPLEGEGKGEGDRLACPSCHSRESGKPVVGVVPDSTPVVGVVSDSTPVVGVVPDPDNQSLDFKKARDGFEKQFLQKVLNVCRGNVSEAARKSGISRRHFYQKIKKYQM